MACSAALAGYGGVNVVAMDAVTRQPTQRPWASWTDAAKGTRTSGSLQRLPPGPTLLDLHLAGYADTAVTVDVIAGATVTVEVVLRPNDVPDGQHGVLRVSVDDSLRRTPVSSAPIVCRHAITGEITFRRSGDVADWTSFVLPGGPYWVVAGPVDDYEAESTLADVRNGEVSSVGIALAPPERVQRGGVSITVREAEVLTYAERFNPVRLAPGSGRSPDGSKDPGRRAKLAAWRTWLGGRGGYAVVTRNYTHAGDPIDSYLVVDNGRCLRIDDSTRDSWGTPKVYVDTILSIRPVWRHYPAGAREAVIVPWSDTLSTEADLQLELGRRDKGPLYY